MTDLCVHDMVPSSCAHCRPQPARPRQVPVSPGPRFTASYPGECSRCDVEFDAGDTIRADGDGGYLGPCCVDVAP